MIVVDASAALAGLLKDGPARSSMGMQPLHVPHLADSEVASGLRRLVLAGRMTAEEGWVTLDVWGRLGISRHPTTGLLPRIWQLRDNLSAYDATYVALAEALGCGVMTADARLSRAPGLRCPVTVVPG